MGVPGLWDVLRPARQTRSLTDIAVVDGFEANTNGMRGFRIGIDASIWFFHANWGKEGENPELRTLFFRCATLLRSPFLPLFVFDGPKRPAFKRGKRINTSSHKLTNGMKSIIEAFGFEWRTAPGEAEAELAYLNRMGVIDAVLSDDVDTFLFGATMVIRNSSNTLSGNKANPVLNSDGRDDKNHSAVYRMRDINAHPSVGIDRGGLILIGLMRGGDYHQAGVAGCGPTIAHGLARCGFGESLYQAALNLPSDLLREFLVNWRTELCHELRTDSQGYLGKKYVALSKKIPNSFPNLEVLDSYVNPITSEKMGRSIEVNRPMWLREPDLGKLAETCEFFFEWGYKEAIIKRFRTVIWPSVVLRILRRSVLDADDRANTTTVPTTPRKKKPNMLPPTPSGTPSKMITKYFSSLRVADEEDSDDEEGNKNLVVKIHSSRQHASTDKLLEYRLEVAPSHLVRLTEAGVKGIRRPEDQDEWATEEGEDEDSDGEGGGKKKGLKKLPPPPDSHLRVWIPACIVKLAEPEVVEEYEEVLRKKAEKKANKGKRASGAKAGTRATKTSRAKVPVGSQSAPVRGRGKKAVLVALEEEEEEEEIVLDLEALREEEEESEEDALPGPQKPRPAIGSSRSVATAQMSTSLKSFYNVQKHVNVGSSSTKATAATSACGSIPSYLPGESGEEHIPIIDLTSRRNPPTSQTTSASSTALTSSRMPISRKTQPTKSSSYTYLSEQDEGSGDESPGFRPPPPKLKFAASASGSGSGSVDARRAATQRTRAPVIPSTSIPSSPMKKPMATFPLTPRKFPLQNLDLDRSHSRSLSRSGSHSRSRSRSPTPVKPPRRKKALYTSSDDDESRHIQKSPRKAGKHASPRSKVITRTPDCSKANGGDKDNGVVCRERSESPSPFRVPLHKTFSGAAHSHHRAIEIIDISSSDSESEVDLRKLPPLLAAKAKVAKANLKAGKMKVGVVKESGERKVVIKEVIDLT